MTDQFVQNSVVADVVSAFDDETGRSVALRMCACGQGNDARALFCVNCGAVLRRSTEAVKRPSKVLPWSIIDVIVVGVGGLILCLIPIIIDALLSCGAVPAILQNKPIEISTGFMLRSIVFQNVVLIGFCFFWLRVIRGQGISALGLCRTHWKAWLWQGVVAGAVIFVLGEFVLPPFARHALSLVGVSSGNLRQLEAQSPQVKLIESILQSSLLVKVLAIAIIAVVAPIGEEIFFRGFAYQGIKNRLGSKWGAVLSSLAFAALHTNIPAFVTYFILGLILVWLFQRTKSLTAPILAHSLNNLVSMLWILLMTR